MAMSYKLHFKQKSVFMWLYLTLIYWLCIMQGKAESISLDHLSAKTHKTSELIALKCYYTVFKELGRNCISLIGNNHMLIAFDATLALDKFTHH